MKKTGYSLLLSVLTYAHAAAVPAKPGIVSVCSADGTEYSVRLVGDERCHQYLTEDGYPIVEAEGRFYYAVIHRDGSMAAGPMQASATMSQRSAAERAYLSTVDTQQMHRAVTNRFALARRERAACNTSNYKNQHSPALLAPSGPPYERGYGLFPDLRFPAYGTQKALVILVEYTDVKFSQTYPKEGGAASYFDRMLNETGFNDYGATGCAAEYYRLNSGDAFCPEFDVYGPITLSHSMSYYGGNDMWGNDMRPEEMVIEACQQLDATVNFADYDRDGDGVIDNVFVFYAGRGEASGGGSSTVWPHSWSLTEAGYGNLYFDGVRLHTYGCSNEWESGRADGVGTFVHEFSHVMGLPDLYATSYTSAFTPGGWSAMDYGPYNNDGMTPPLYGAFERYALGWVEPFEIDGAMDVTLPPIGDNVCGIARTGRDTEFFLFENRRQEGWDTYVPGHGMLVWHIDYNERIWDRNEVNDNPSHQYVDIIEADGTQSESSRAGDSFPGAAGVTAFTAETRPAFQAWDRTPIQLPLTEIAETGEGLVCFKVCGGAPPVVEAPLALDADNIGIDRFTCRWSAVEEAEGYLLDVYTVELGERLTDSLGFDDGTGRLPKGWETTSMTSYAMPSYCGESAPSLRLGHGDWLRTPAYAEAVDELVFWHRGNSTSDSDVLNVYAVCGEYESLVATIAVCKDKGGVTTTISDMPADAHSARIEYIRKSGNGSVAIDDLKVMHGYEILHMAAPGYDALETGLCCEYTAEGLQSDTEYRYTVRAIADGRVSEPSNEVTVRTADIEDLVQAAHTFPFPVEVDGREVSCGTDSAIEVIDMTGMLVAKGIGKVTLPRAGIFVVSVPSTGAKAKITAM